MYLFYWVIKNNNKYVYIKLCTCVIEFNNFYFNSFLITYTKILHKTNKNNKIKQWLCIM